MRNVCETELCDAEPLTLCLECLQVFILEAVADAVSDRAAELKLYHERKRRAN